MMRAPVDPVANQENDGQQPEPAAKTSPEALALRAAPRRTVRFKRGVIIGGAAAGALALAGGAWLALSPKGLHLVKPNEQAVSDRRTPADAVANLPGDYSKVAATQATAFHPLGPPLPGDLGRPVLERQRQLEVGDGLTEDPKVSRPALSPEQEAAQAERQRVTAQAHQAREAGVMVQSSGRAAATAMTSVMPGLGQSLPDVAAAEQPASGESGKLTLDPERDQNNQQRKLDFVGPMTGRDGATNAHALQRPTSPWQVMAGSVIAASLLTGLNSDLPGMVVAQVTENVFDTVTGRTLLIPQGSRLIGSYDSVVAFGQSRALLVWQRIILPDGASIQLDNLPATDAAGYAGLSDKVDFHTWRLLKGVALSTLLGVGTELSLGDDESDLVRAVRQSTQQTASQAGQQIVAKQLAVQPTLRVRPGWPLRVVVHKDLTLRPWRAS